jgi:hypothetical protein
MDPDPDSGGTKSYGSGSATLDYRLIQNEVAEYGTRDNFIDRYGYPTNT